MDRRWDIDRITNALGILICLAFLIQLRDIPRSGMSSGWVDTTKTTRDPEPRGDVALSVRLTGSCKATSPCPPPPATVRVFWKSPDGRYGLADQGVPNPAGELEFTGLPRGLLWVTAEAPGYERRSAYWVGVSGPSTLALHLGLAVPLTITVMDERGAPIPEATVLVTGKDPLPFGTLANPRGQARFERLGESPWSVKASARGYESVTESTVRSDHVITLRALGEIQVQVLSAQGTPQSAEIWIVGSRLWPARSVSTDAQGKASIRGLLAGSYDLRARTDQEVSETEGVALERQPVQATLRLKSGRRVNVLVTDATDSAETPIAGADVVLVENGLGSFPARGRTDAGGRVELGPYLPGAAVISVRAAGFVVRAAAALPDPPPLPYRISLLRGARLEGRVVDVRGFPVEGATLEVVGSDIEGMPVAETPASVRFRDSHFAWSLAGPTPLIPSGELGVTTGPVPPIPRGNPGSGDLASLGSPFPAARTSSSAELQDWVTRSDGTFLAEPVTPGRLRVLVHHPQYVEAASDEVIVGPGTTGRIEVILQGGGVLAGRVFDDRGRPAAGVRVEATALLGRFERITQTESDGRFEFAVVPGQVVLALGRAEDPGRRVLRKSQTVPEGRRTEIDLTLPPLRAACQVRVEDERGQPVPGAQVTAISLETDIPLRETQFTGPDGLVRLDDLAGLNLEITAEAPGWLRFSRTLSSAPEALTATLVSGTLVTGRVTTTRGRTWVAQARITLAAGGFRWTASTDREGAFRVEGVPPGPAQITVTHADHAPYEGTITVSRPARIDRGFEIPAIDLVESGGVEGTVVDSRGQPVRGARVSLGWVPAYLPLGELPAGMSLTDGDGHFSLSVVTPGTQVVGAYAPELGRTELRDVSVSAGRTTSGLRLVLAGPLEDRDSGAPANLALSLVPRGSPEILEITHVARGSEAERAGLQEGDRLLAVDGHSPKNSTEARRLLGGAENTDVLIEILRSDQVLRRRVTRERVRQ